LNKLTGFILIFIIGGILVGWKEYEKRARGDVQKSLSSQKLMSVEQSPLTLVQRTQLETMAKLERSKIRVMVEHDNSPITDTYPMILDASGSYDPDLGDEIYFNWIQISGKQVRLKPNNKSAKVSFLGEAGEYVFELTVTDNYGARNTILKSVLIEPEPNVAPVINLKVRQGAELE
jgi:hypothetical protein